MPIFDSIDFDGHEQSHAGRSLRPSSGHGGAEKPPHQVEGA